MTGNDVVLSAVEKRYNTGDGGVQALASTSLAFGKGEFVCIVGPSGCGKTTLLQMLAGFVEPTEGSIMVGGKHVRGPHSDLGVVFQKPNLYPWKSVASNVEFGLKMRGVAKAERAEHANEFLKMVGLDGFGGRRPYELSGGMQQRCQIARVLVNNPRILLMDEPFGALDAMTREKLQLDLLRLWREEQKTVVFITHSVEEAVLLGTRIIVMSARPGRVIYDQQVDVVGKDRDPLAARSTPEFISLRDKVAAKIYEAQGVAESIG